MTHLFGQLTPWVDFKEWWKEIRYFKTMGDLILNESNTVVFIENKNGKYERISQRLLFEIIVIIFNRFKIKWKKLSIFCYYYRTGFLWFRIFGYGLKIKNWHENGLIFSERMGVNKPLIIGKWAIGILKKGKI